MIIDWQEIIFQAQLLYDMADIFFARSYKPIGEGCGYISMYGNFKVLGFLQQLCIFPKIPMHLAIHCPAFALLSGEIAHEKAGI